MKDQLELAVKTKLIFAGNINYVNRKNVDLFIKRESNQINVQCISTNCTIEYAMERTKKSIYFDIHIRHERDSFEFLKCHKFNTAASNN